jgi:membrane-associated protein
MVSWLVDQLLKLNAWVALFLVFLLPALEASVFLGFVLPGETAVVVGGFLAYEGRVPLAAVFAAAIVGAILGDSVGYEVGKKWGDSLLAKAPKRFVKPVHVTQGKELINRLGGRAVFTGRWTAVLRALVPSLCGTAKMRYRTFLLWNALGGVTWATAFILIGYLAGSAWKRIEHYTNIAGYALFGAAIVAVLGIVLWNRRKQAKRDAETEAEMTTEQTEQSGQSEQNELSEQDRVQAETRDSV